VVPVICEALGDTNPWIVLVLENIDRGEYEVKAIGNEGICQIWRVRRGDEGMWTDWTDLFTCYATHAHWPIASFE
jgi:hypothetical protein